MRRLTHREAIEAEIRRRSREQAAADFLAFAHKLESGTYPSAMYEGQRVEVLLHQIHPVVGERWSIRPIGGPVTWVQDVTDVLGTPRESIVPDGLFR